MSHTAIDSAVLTGFATDGKRNCYQLVIPGGHHTFDFEWKPDGNGVVMWRGLAFSYQEAEGQKATVIATLPEEEDSIALFDRIIGHPAADYRRRLASALETELQHRILHASEDAEAMVKSQTDVPLMMGIALYMERIRDRLQRHESTTK